MKKILLLIFMIGLFATGLFAQEPVQPASSGILDILKNSWVEILLAFLAFLKVIVNLTPTEKDNAIFAWIDKIINWIIPNRKAGGGSFPLKE